MDSNLIMNEIEKIMKDLISSRYEGECNRCGACCEIYESGKPCRHLKYEKIKEKESDEWITVAYCNPETLVGGYYGRPLGCALYPYQDDSDLLEKCSYKKKEIK